MLYQHSLVRVTYEDALIEQVLSDALPGEGKIEEPYKGFGHGTGRQ